MTWEFATPAQLKELGERMHGLVRELYPVCRSITGPGLRHTLSVLAEQIPLVQHEVASGSAALDWIVPPEWSIRDAYVKDASGRRVIDFHALNLHVVQYSQPISARMSLAQLRPHLHSLPEHPGWIPYRTSYYEPAWGFCLAHQQLEQLAEGEYEVRIDSELSPGSLSYGEVILPGETTDEVLFSSHVCHPSLANDNLSGVAVAVELIRWLQQRSQRRYTYRFVFAPGTIGALVWLSRNRETLARIRAGLVLTLLGDAGPSTYKQTRRGNTDVDRAAAHVLETAGSPHTIREFTPTGYDERQYGSPGFDLPVGCLMRTPHAEYPEYHTSADDLSLVRPASLADSWQKAAAIVDLLERNVRYRNECPYGEPQLGRRGVFAALAERPDRQQVQPAIPWVLNLSDGQHSLLEMAERSKLNFWQIAGAADLLAEQGLLTRVAEGRA